MLIPLHSSTAGEGQHRERRHRDNGYPNNPPPNTSAGNPMQPSYFQLKFASSRGSDKLWVNSTWTLLWKLREILEQFSGQHQAMSVNRPAKLQQPKRKPTSRDKKTTQTPFLPSLQGEPKDKGLCCRWLCPYSNSSSQRCLRKWRWTLDALLQKA